ncbi:outer membrane protein assembly factor BamB family protein [Streptacidiphilus griseoplanus]|uniref:outer membrane protein assembly factor BamB family protein n=1 Tax=Peterkaempfera griseoplana TaxID=66896 RepID=UPI000AD4924E|nr:PQQ-binding-like beta-propeller repeat protein [Peterkaempfera griseoplana]
MAQEPSGSGDRPSEYDYGQQWQHPGQASSAEGGIPGGYQTYGTGQEAWSDPAQAQQQNGQYAGYDQQQYGQGYGDQAYYGGYGYPYPAGGDQQQSPAYGEGASGYQDYQAYPEYQQGYQTGYQGQPEYQQVYQDYQTQPYQQQSADGTGEATQQWQALPDDTAAADPGPAPGSPDAFHGHGGSEGPGPNAFGADGFGASEFNADGPGHDGEPADEAADDPGAPRPSLADRARAVLGGGPDGPSRRTRTTRLAVGAAALVVLVGAGVYVAGSGGSGGNAAAGSGATGTSSANFAVDHTRTWAAQPAAAGADDGLLGGWLLPKAVVRGDATGVHAYDIATGKPVWTAQTPVPGAVPCGMSPTVAGGIGAVLFTPKAGSKSCSLLSAVDTATGKQKWTKTLSGTKDAYTARVMVNDTRVVAVGDSKAVGYEASTGKWKWDNKGRGKFCTLSGTGSGSTLLVHSSCADSNPKEQIVALDAASGRLIWWRGLGTPKTVTVLSAEPSVVLTTGGSAADDRVRSWDNKGNPGAEIPVAQAGGRLDVEHGPLDATPGVFFSGTTMATALVPADGSTPANGSVTAIDLKSGKAVWTTSAQEKGKVQPVGIDADGLMVATEERTDQSAHLSRFALADGKESAGGGFPKGTGSLLTAGRLLTSDGLVVAVPAFTSTYSTSATAYTSAK